MITETEFEGFHEQVREEYSFPTTQIVYHEDKSMPFYIDNNAVHVVLEMIKDEKIALHVLRHEIGHMHHSPVSIKNHKICLEQIKATFGDNAEYEFLSHVLNVMYDMITDYYIVVELKDDLKHFTLDAMKDMKGKENQNPYLKLLLGYYSYVCNEEFTKLDEKMEETVSGCFNIVQSHREHNKKIELLTELLYDMIKKEARKNQSMQKEMEKLRDALQQMKESMEKAKTQVPSPQENNNGKASAKITTVEDKDSDKGKKEALEQLMDKDSEKMHSLGASYRVDLPPFELLAMRARKNIQFKLKIEGGMGGKTTNAGLFAWNTENPIEDLDIEESLQNGGMLIPEITTVQFERKESKNVKEMGLPQIYVCVDTSGSMNREETIVALYSFIEAAKHYGVEVGVVMFDTSAYFSENLSYNYKRLEENIYNSFRQGGTTLSRGAEAVDRILKRNSLVIFVSDFCDGASEKARVVEMEKKWMNHSKVCNIVMFNDRVDAPMNHVSSISCKTESDLQDLLIRFVNENVW